MVLRSAVTVMHILGCFIPLAGGADFELVRDQVTFDNGVGEINRAIAVPIMIQDDLLVEGTETFSLAGSVVTTGTGATFVGGPATISILDNDGKRISVEGQPTLQL